MPARRTCQRLGRPALRAKTAVARNVATAIWTSFRRGHAIRFQNAHARILERPPWGASRILFRSTPAKAARLENFADIQRRSGENSSASTVFEDLCSETEGTDCDCRADRQNNIGVLDQCGVPPCHASGAGSVRLYRAAYMNPNGFRQHGRCSERIIDSTTEMAGRASGSTLSAFNLGARCWPYVRRRPSPGCREGDELDLPRVY